MPEGEWEPESVNHLDSLASMAIAQVTRRVYKSLFSAIEQVTHVLFQRRGLLIKADC